MIFYLVICGFASIATPAFTYWDITEDDELFVIIWCCIMRFFVGLSFAFISAASIKFATQFVTSSTKITRIIAYLHYAWPLSTTLNIFAGYIFLNSWMLVFVIPGFALIFLAIFAKVIFKCTPLHNMIYKMPFDEYDDGEDQQYKLSISDVEYIVGPDEDEGTPDIIRRTGLQILLTDKNSLIIIFVSFFMALRGWSLYIICGSLWMEDTFHLNAGMVGWSSLTLMVGEVIGLAAMSILSSEWKLRTSALATLTLQLVTGAVVFILTAIYGDDITLVCLISAI